MFLCLDWVFVILISFRWQIPKKEALRIEIVETAEVRRRRKRELPLSRRTFLMFVSRESIKIVLD